MCIGVTDKFIWKKYVQNTLCLLPDMIMLFTIGLTKMCSIFYGIDPFWKLFLIFCLSIGINSLQREHVVEIWLNNNNYPVIIEKSSCILLVGWITSTRTDVDSVACVTNSCMESIWYPRITKSRIGPDHGWPGKQNMWSNLDVKEIFQMVGFYRKLGISD